MRSLVPFVVLGLLGCGGETEPGSGGSDASGASGSAGGGSGDSSSSSTASAGSTSCDEPDAALPASSLRATSVDVAAAVGVVTRSESNEVELETCFSPTADCAAAPVTLRLGPGLAMSVPLNALVRVEMEPHHECMCCCDGDQAPTVIVTNVPSADGYDNPVASDDRLYFYSSAHRDPNAPGIDARLETVCQEDRVTQFLYVSDLIVRHDDGEARFAEGDTQTLSLGGVAHEVSFLGAWEVESGFCRWQVARREP